MGRFVTLLLQPYTRRGSPGMTETRGALRSEMELSVTAEWGNLPCAAIRHGPRSKPPETPP